MAGGFLERNITFWGMVGVVMTALKLKDRYDECEFSITPFARAALSFHWLDRELPTDEHGLGHGPVALHSPLDEEAGRNLPDTLSIDTTIPSARPKRKRMADCCVCCGLKYVSSPC